jgi:hypothetical protein
MLRTFLDRCLEMGTTIVVLCGGFTLAGCASHDELSPAPRKVVTTRVADLSVSHATTLTRARERVRWVGESHRSAMAVVHQEVTARRAAKQPLPKKGSAEYCKLLERVGRAGIAIADRGRGLTRTPFAQTVELQAIPEIERCARKMSIFHRTTALPPAQQITELDYEPLVSGAYESYLDLMEAQVNASNGSAAGVSAAVNNVLASALSDGVPEGDFLALASFAELAESSAIEWNSYNWSSSGSGSCATGDRCLMSLFGRKTVRGKIGAVIAADVGGCLSNVRGWSGLRTTLMLPAWKALAARCGVRGGLASGAAILAFI